MAVVVAVAMIMVVVMMTFAGEKYREQEHQAGDEGRGPGIAQGVSREERIEGDVTRERPGAEVVGEDPKAPEAAVVGAALDVDRQETGEEDGGKDQEEDGEGSPAFHGVVVDLIGLLLEVGRDGGLSLGLGGRGVEGLALGGGLGLGDGLVDQGGLDDGFLVVGFRLRKRMAHVMIGAGGHAVEDGSQDDGIDGQAEAAEGLGKVQREAKRIRP